MCDEQGAIAIEKENTTYQRGKAICSREVSVNSKALLMLRSITYDCHPGKIVSETSHGQLLSGYSAWEDYYR